MLKQREDGVYLCIMCETPVPGYVPQMCCSGIECSCMGLPTEPPLCSVECGESLYHPKEKQHKRRGEEIIMAVAEAAIERMNDPKNVKKGDWNLVYFDNLLEYLEEEIGEFLGAPIDNVLDEAGDVLAYLAMICDKLGVIEKRGKQ